jgi:hypothetical protein
MAVVWSGYVRKNPEIQVLHITDLTETADWLEANLVDPAVNRSLISYGTLFFSAGSIDYTVQVGACLVIDSNNKIFKMSKEILDAFYDPTP